MIHYVLVFHVHFVMTHVWLKQIMDDLAKFGDVTGKHNM